VDKELANVRMAFTSGKLSSYDKKKYVWKLVYINMMGYDVDFGHMEMISLVSSPSYAEKLVGYMSVAVMLRNTDPQITLVVQAIKSDLASTQDPIQCLALCAIANIGGKELAEAVAVDDAPTVVRFSKGSVGTEFDAVRRTADGVDVLREAPHKDVLIVTVGPMAKIGLEVAERLADQGIGATVVDPRWVVPVPGSVIELAREHRILVSIEDGVRVGGIGTRIRQDLRAAGVDTAVDELGLPDEFLEHASREEILERVGLTSQAIARDLVAQVLGTKVPVARPLPDETAAVDQDERAH